MSINQKKVPDRVRLREQVKPGIAEYMDYIHVESPYEATNALIMLGLERYREMKPQTTQAQAQG